MVLSNHNRIQRFLLISLRAMHAQTPQLIHRHRTSTTGENNKQLYADSSIAWAQHLRVVNCKSTLLIGLYFSKTSTVR